MSIVTKNVHKYSPRRGLLTYTKNLAFTEYAQEKGKAAEMSVHSWSGKKLSHPSCVSGLCCALKAHL